MHFHKGFCCSSRAVALRKTCSLPEAHVYRAGHCDFISQICPFSVVKSGCKPCPAPIPWEGGGPGCQSLGCLPGADGCDVQAAAGRQHYTVHGLCTRPVSMPLPVGAQATGSQDQAPPGLRSLWAPWAMVGFASEGSSTGSRASPAGLVGQTGCPAQQEVWGTWAGVLGRGSLSLCCAACPQLCCPGSLSLYLAPLQDKASLTVYMGRFPHRNCQDSVSPLVGSRVSCFPGPGCCDVLHTEAGQQTPQVSPSGTLPATPTPAQARGQ